jgi:ATP-dependent Clp protease ATP-binding subunit ClpX
LRAIIESRLLDVMFEIPGRSDIRRVVIDSEVISGPTRPKIYDQQGVRLNWTEEGKLLSSDSAA